MLLLSCSGVTPGNVNLITALCKIKHTGTLDKYEVTMKETYKSVSRQKLNMGQ